jgi:hypothetical protein
MGLPIKETIWGEMGYPTKTEDLLISFFLLCLLEGL